MIYMIGALCGAFLLGMMAGASPAIERRHRPKRSIVGRLPIDVQMPESKREQIAHHESIYP